MYSKQTKVRILNKYNGVIIDTKVVHRKRINLNVIKYKILVHREDNLPYFFWLTEDYFQVYKKYPLFMEFFINSIKSIIKKTNILKIQIDFKMFFK